MCLLAQLADENPAYLSDAIKYRDIYHEKMEETRGFPETFDAEGEFLQNAVYKSIRQRAVEVLTFYPFIDIY